MFRVHKETPEGNAKREHFSKVTNKLMIRRDIWKHLIKLSSESLNDCQNNLG